MIDKRTFDKMYKMSTFEVINSNKFTKEQKIEFLDVLRNITDTIFIEDDSDLPF